jgi:DNA polymerase III epsilon subunit-like protein
MTASALRHAQAQWTAADPMIDDSARALVASAHAAEPESIERKHAFARIAAMSAGLVPLTASIDMSTQVLPASEFVAGFGIGGNSDAARSLRAKMQRRDRYGKFAFMGGGFSFSLRGMDGLFSKISGSVVGATGDGDAIELEITGNDILPDGIYTMPASKGSSVKAILSKKTVSDLPNKGIATAKDDVFVDANDIMPTRKDAPTGWTKIDTPEGMPLAWGSEDGYFVQKEGDVLTLHRANLDDNSIGQEVARGNSWSDMQKGAIKDQDDYKKVLETADADGSGPTEPPAAVTTAYDDLAPGETPKGWSTNDLGTQKTSSYSPEQQVKVHTSPQGTYSVTEYYDESGKRSFVIRRQGEDSGTIQPEAGASDWNDAIAKIKADQPKRKAEREEKAAKAAEFEKPAETPITELDYVNTKMLAQQLADVAKNNGRVKFSYNGEERTVSPRSVYFNPDTAQYNVVARDGAGKDATFIINEIDFPEKPKAPAVEVTPEQKRQADINRLVRDLTLSYPEPKGIETGKTIRPIGSRTQESIASELARLNLTDAEKQDFIESAGGNGALAKKLLGEPEVAPSEQAAETPEFVSPGFALDVLNKGYSDAQEILGEIPDTDLDNLDDDDAEAISRVGDLFDSAQEALDSVDPVGSDNNDLLFEAARADLGEAAELLSQASNDGMQNAGFALKETIDEFIGLPQVDFGGGRAERAERAAREAPTDGPTVPPSVDTIFDNMAERDPDKFNRYKGEDLYGNEPDEVTNARMALDIIYSVPLGRSYDDPETGINLDLKQIADLSKKYDKVITDWIKAGKPQKQTPALTRDDVRWDDEKNVYTDAAGNELDADQVDAVGLDSTLRTAPESDIEELSPQSLDLVETVMPDFLVEQFDYMFNTPDGAYKVNIFDMYESQGRTGQASADFTDDPQVLSQKFTKEELTVALADAVLAKDDGDASGYGNLPFENGDEPVKAEAIYDALTLGGQENPEKILSEIYDSALPVGSGTNAEKFAQRQSDGNPLGGPDFGLVPVSIFNSGFVDAVERNGALGTPSKTQNSVDLMKSHEETNPKIKSIANDLKAFQDAGEQGDGENLKPTLEKYLPLAYSTDPDDQAAFRGYWGMLMSLDGGSSEPEDYARSSGFRSTLFDSIKKQSGSKTEDEAIAAYNEFIDNFGEFSDFVTDKDAIAEGFEDLDAQSVASDFFRLVKESARPNEVPLFRIIGVSTDNKELLDQYITVGNSVGFDPRPFSTTDTTKGTFLDSLAWNPGKESHRVVFVAEPGSIDSIDATSVSWFPGENEHVGYGQVEIKSVKRQPSGIPNRPDEYIVEIGRTETTPDDLTGVQSAEAEASGVFNLETYDVSDWRKTGGQAGSNEGGFYEDADGNAYYVKVPKSQSHADNEVLASALYEELGVPSAQVRTGDNNGDLRVVSKIVDGSRPDFADRVRSGDAEYLDKLRADFAVDAWLANWDVTGTGFDNVVTDVNNEPTRVDPGGSLMWRAQGEPKGGLFGDTVGEIDTLRDAQMSPFGSRVFGSMTDDDVRESAKKLLNIEPSQIDKIVNSVVTDPEEAAFLSQRLKARRQDILDRFNLTDADKDDLFGDPVPLTNSIGFEAQDLQAGDILGKDSFVIESVSTDVNGKTSVTGYYPGHESQTKQWNQTDVVDAARGSTVPPKGTNPAINAPKKPRTPAQPAFQGDIATQIANARDWAEARDILNDREIVFFDYETTGFGPGNGNQPVQLGAVKVRNGEVVDRFNMFMDPTEELSDWSRANLKDGNGNPLTDEFLSQQVGMGEAHALFADWMGENPTIAAHNLPFDREILERVSADANVDVKPAGYIDTLSLSRALVDKQSDDNPSGTPSHSLKQLMDHQGLEFGAWHTADADSEASANLFNSMLNGAIDDPNGNNRLGVVKDQPSQFEKDMADHQAAVKAYQDALAKYNMDVAVAAAWNCGGSGLIASVGEGDGPCSVPSVDDLIDSSTIKPGELSDPEAITSGNPNVANDGSNDPVDAAPAAKELTPEQIEERNQNIDESFAVVADQADVVLDPEQFKHKNVLKKNLEKARDDVADVRKKLESGEITEEEAVSRLQAILDAMPTANTGADASAADVEIGVFQDAIADLRDALDIDKMPIDYGRPVGPGLPPPELGPDFGYSKDGVFLVPGSRVRDKFGYLGTVVRYQENGWIGIYYKRDVDGEISLKNIKQLTSVPDNGDLRPWIYDPNIGEGKRPANWKELVTPEEMAAADAAAKAAKATKKSAGGKSPKAKAPQGATEVSEVPATPEVPELSDREKKFSDPTSFASSMITRSWDNPNSPWALTSEDAIWDIEVPIEQGLPIIANLNGKDVTLRIDALSFDKDQNQFVLKTFIPGTTGPQRVLLKDLKPIKPVDMSVAAPWKDMSYDLTDVDGPNVRKNVELLMAEGRFEDAGKLASGFNNALNSHIEKGMTKGDNELVRLAEDMRDAHDSRFGPDVLSVYYNPVQNAALGRYQQEDLVKDFKKGWASQEPEFAVDLSGRPRPEIEDPKPISASSFEGVNSLIDAVDKSRDSSNTRVFHSAAIDGGDIEDFEVRSSITVDSGTGEKKLRLKFKLTAWAGQEKSVQATDEYLDTAITSEDVTWTVENVIRIPRSKILPDGTIEIDNEASSLFTYGTSQAARTLVGELDVSTGKAKITILRGNQDNSLKPVSDENSAQAFHNMVTIDLPIDATEEDIKKALENAGVRDVRATEPADVKILAENRLLSVFARQTDASVNERSQIKRNVLLAQIKDKWGVTADDIAISTDSSGFLTYKMPQEVANKITQETGATVLEHSVSIYGIRSALASSMPNTVGTNGFVNLSKDEQNDLVAEVLADLLSDSGGLKATIHRFTEGAAVGGQSSSEDIGTGGAAYVFTRPKDYAKPSISQDDDVRIYYDPLKAYQRVDFYANEHDEYGRRFDNHDVIKNAKAYFSDTEVMFKNGLSSDEGLGMLLSPSMRQKVLKALDERGVKEIAGMPVDKFVVDYFDIDIQRGGNVTQTSQLVTWMNNSGYGASFRAIMNPFMYAALDDVLMNPVASVPSVPGSEYSIIAIDDKLSVVVYSGSENKFYKVNLIKSNKDSGTAVELKAEELESLFEGLKISHEASQDSNMSDASLFTDWPGYGGFGDYAPLGVVGKDKDIMVRRVETAIDKMKQGVITPRQTAQYMIKSLLAQYGGKTVEFYGEMHKLIKLNPELESAIRDLVADLAKPQ